MSESSLKKLSLKDLDLNLIKTGSMFLLKGCDRSIESTRGKRLYQQQVETMLLACSENQLITIGNALGLEHSFYLKDKKKKSEANQALEQLFLKYYNDLSIEDKDMLLPLFFDQFLEKEESNYIVNKETRNIAYTYYYLLISKDKLSIEELKANFKYRFTHYDILPLVEKIRDLPGLPSEKFLGEDQGEDCTTYYSKKHGFFCCTCKTYIESKGWKCEHVVSLARKTKWLSIIYPEEISEMDVGSNLLWQIIIIVVAAVFFSYLGDLF